MSVDNSVQESPSLDVEYIPEPFDPDSDAPLSPPPMVRQPGQNIVNIDITPLMGEVSNTAPS